MKTTALSMLKNKLFEQSRYTKRTSKRFEKKAFTKQDRQNTKNFIAAELSA